MTPKTHFSGRRRDPENSKCRHCNRVWSLFQTCITGFCRTKVRGGKFEQGRVFWPCPNSYVKYYGGGPPGRPGKDHGQTTAPAGKSVFWGFLGRPDSFPTFLDQTDEKKIFGFFGSVTPLCPGDCRFQGVRTAKNRLFNARSAWTADGRNEEGLKSALVRGTVFKPRRRSVHMRNERSRAGFPQ